MHRMTIFALLMLALLGSREASAQRHEHGATADSAPTPRAMMGQGMMGEAAMMGMGGEIMQQAMPLMPRHVLRNAEALELTSAQVEQLNQLASHDPNDRQGHMTAMQEAHGKLKALFEAETPDPAAVQAAAEEFLDLHAQMQARHIAGAVAVRAILTTEQLEKLQTLSCCEMGGGMMMRGSQESSAAPGRHQHEGS